MGPKGNWRGRNHQIMVRDASTCSCSWGGGESGGPAARQIQFSQNRRSQINGFKNFEWCPMVMMTHYLSSFVDVYTTIYRVPRCLPEIWFLPGKYVRAVWHSQWIRQEPLRMWVWVNCKSFPSQDQWWESASSLNVTHNVSVYIQAAKSSKL